MAYYLTIIIIFINLFPSISFHTKEIPSKRNTLIIVNQTNIEKFEKEFKIPFGFTIKVPNNWSMEKVLNSIVLRNPNIAEEYGFGYMMFNQYSLKKGDTVENSINLYTHDNYLFGEEVSRGLITINGKKGIWFIHHPKAKNNILLGKSKTFFFFNNGKILNLSYSASEEQFEKYELFYDSILNTIIWYNSVE